MLLTETDKYYLYNGDALDLVSEMQENSIDLTVTSPPYFMGKEYDTSTNIDDFISFHKEFLPEIVRITKSGGSICWQVGYYLKNGISTPLDFHIYNILQHFPNIFLRNRIIWSFGHGLHARNRFSGRHEMILWFTKDEKYHFDLDSIRIPQKYPGKKYYKGQKKGQHSGNPLGKNPSDIWEIPNVKSNHPEKTLHPCQFPVALVQRLIRGLSPKNGIIFDPFMGVATSGVAAIIEGRRFIGAEILDKYYKISVDRIKKAMNSEIEYRPLDKPIHEPNPNTSVAQKPCTFK